MKTTVYTVITGSLARDAQIKYTSNGLAIVSLAIPSEVGYGDKKKTIWQNISWFGKKAEKRLDKLTKGTTLTIVCDAPDIAPKGNALYYTAKDVSIIKYGNTTNDFESEVLSGYVSDFDDEMPLF